MERRLRNVAPVEKCISPEAVEKLGSHYNSKGFLPRLL